jgi:hypothetical protein
LLALLDVLHSQIPPSQGPHVPRLAPEMSVYAKFSIHFRDCLYS